MIPPGISSDQAVSTCLGLCHIPLLSCAQLTAKGNVSGICSIEAPDWSCHNKYIALSNLFFFFNNDFIKRIYIPMKFTLKVYNSVGCGVFPVLCIHPQIQFLQKKPSPLAIIPTFPPLAQKTNSPSSKDFPILKNFHKWNHSMCGLCVQRLPPSVFSVCVSIVSTFPVAV